MHFLEANDVVVVQEFFGVIKFGFPVPLYAENRSNKAPGVPSNTSQAFRKEGAHIRSVVVLEEYPRSEAGRATRRSP